MTGTGDAISKADYEYFNGSIKKHETQSSVLISNSKYLNHSGLRALVAQEYLRRNGADMPNTAFIPEVAKILHELEDLPTIFRLFEEEKARKPEFKRWLDEKKLSNFTADDLKHCKEGTLGYILHDFIVNSGYNIDVFFQGMPVINDFTFYLKERAYIHDIEHMITGFGPNHGGEVALLFANLRATYNYFTPELAAFFNRVPSYLISKTIMKAGLYYPESFKLQLDAQEWGLKQGNSWKMPLMMVPWRDYIDRPIADIREELGITPVIPDGLWDWTNEISEDPREPAHPTSVAAE